MSSNPKVAIIIVNWNGREDTLDCLRSLSHLTYQNYRIILVDNGSNDGSSAAVEADFSAVKIIRSEVNLRFAGGNNLGLKEVLDSDDAYCLLLNNDTTAEPDFLDLLIDTAEEDPKCGLVAPKILYHHNPRVIWFGGGVIKPQWGYVRHLGLRQPDDGRCNQSGKMSFLTGCCLLIKREVLEKVGLLDEGFYLYSEDADYCLRAVKASFNLYYQPASRIYHKVSRSTGGAYNLNKWTRRYQSLWRLVRKHTSPLTYPLFFLNFLFELLTLPINALVQTFKLKS